VTASQATGARVRGLSPENGVKALFFSYFGLVGAFSPYLSLYFAAVGLSITQIGVLMAMPQVVRIFGPPFWGWLADALDRRLLPLRISAVAAVVCAGAVWLAGGDYLWLVLVLGALFFATSAQAPLAESIALTVAGGDAGRYGQMRLWGSIGFVLAVAVTGPVLDRIGVARLPAVLLTCCLMLAAVAWMVPEAARRSDAVARPVWRMLGRPVPALFFLGNFLMLFAHAALYAFYSLHLDRLGFSKTAIGMIWTLGVLAEIVLFRVQRPLFERFGALPLLSFSLAVAALRFALIGWGGASLVLIVVTQLMHAVTFGVHHSAVMALLHRWFAPAQQGRAQALYAVTGYGLGGSLGGLGASLLWDGVSPAAAFYGAAVAAALGWGAVELCRRLDYARPLGHMDSEVRQ